MKIFNSKFNTILFLIIICFWIINLCSCKNSKQRKEILNYLLAKKTSSFSKKLKDDLPKALTFFEDESKLFQEYIISSLEETISANPNCIDYLTRIYESSIFPSMKLIRDSSHSLSKLGSYYDCKYGIYYDSYNESISSSNISYNYILFYNTPDEISLRPVLFSICVPHVTDCGKEDYASILSTFNMKTELIDTSYLGEIETYILDESSKALNEHFYIGVIASAFCVLIMIFGFFPGIPVCMFKCCFKKKFSKSKKIDIYENSSLIKLEKAFDIKESIAEIYAKNADVGYDTGISFVKGLRGIFLFLFILGNTLETVYQYPLQKTYNQYFNSNSLSFLFFFNRCSKSVF